MSALPHPGNANSIERIWREALTCPSPSGYLALCTRRTKPPFCARHQGELRPVWAHPAPDCAHLSGFDGWMLRDLQATTAQLPFDRGHRSLVVPGANGGVRDAAGAVAECRRDNYSRSGGGCGAAPPLPAATRGNPSACASATGGAACAALWPRSGGSARG